MKKLMALAVFTAGLVSPSLFAAQEWALDQAASKLSFTAQQGKTEFTGGFKEFTALIRFSPDDLANSVISATINTGSAFAGAAERDSALPGQNWFSTAHFPLAYFSTKSIKATGSEQYVADATLSIRGITKDVRLPFTLKIENGKAHAVGKIVLNRQDYGVGQGEFAKDTVVKFPVTVNFDVWATPQKTVEKPVPKAPAKP